MLAGIHTLRGRIDASDFRHHHQGVGLAAQDESDRLSDIRRRQGRRGHLVEKRLKQMVVAAVDEQHVHRRVPERTGSEQPTETTPDDHDLRSPCHLQQMSPDWRPQIGSQVGLLRKSGVASPIPAGAPGGWAKNAPKTHQPRPRTVALQPLKSHARAHPDSEEPDLRRLFDCPGSARNFNHRR